MPEGTARLFAQAKAEKTAGSSATNEELAQGKALLKRFSLKEKPKGRAVVPPPRPQPDRPEPADVDFEKAEVPGEKHASRSIDIEDMPMPAPPPEEEKTAEDFYDDDPLALVLGEEEAGLLEEVHKVAADDTVYSSKEPHPLVLFKSLGRDFNRLEWTMWEPEAIVRAIAETSAQPPSEETRNMIGALAGLVESEAFWNEYHIFLWTAQALNGEVPDMSILPELRPEEVVFAVGVAAQIRDEDPMPLPNGEVLDGVQLGEDILATIAAVFHQAGLVYAPDPVTGANRYLDKLHDSGARALARQVGDAWEAASQDSSYEPDFDEVGIQVARLLDIRAYVRDPFGT